MGEIISEYTFKRGYRPDSERIRNILEEVFGARPVESDGKMVISYGAIKEMKAWVQDKKLYVETVSDLSVKDEKLILDTNKRFRDFLEEATGYTAKERLKMAKKAVSGEY
ncbi:Uncharacterized protein conserved in archaea [Methanocella conradii HZ254]|uniref:Uncharacterized protein conserved in archaea n=1 Tax=Methanocella conradii (strain DSM 24694 / JCM 17849 / CGMCC 1.5162 / HZ254) TaxID=1041930 RepID=H8I4U9_METCZ|nr:DUF5611 family protein [Methanocella conradii]AFD01043.1 Uncharacterized protein conserved in archaea [Methanocella conradii HZ254]MDI6897865.1 DUF5611 family protein [Methanocella conradii]